MYFDLVKALEINVLQLPFGLLFARYQYISGDLVSLLGTLHRNSSSFQTSWI